MIDTPGKRFKTVVFETAVGRIVFFVLFVGWLYEFTASCGRAGIA